MMKNFKSSKAITMVAMIVTIIVLLILSAVTIAELTGNGLLGKTITAKWKDNQAEAEEKMNLKITGIEVKSYSETKKLPTLQYLADELNADDEIDYVSLTSKKFASKEPIKLTNENSSIFTKLSKYPYEFEINDKLQLASINGVKVASENKNGNMNFSDIKINISEQGNLTIDGDNDIVSFFLIQDDKYVDSIKGKTCTVRGKKVGQSTNIYIVGIDSDANLYKSNIVSYVQLEIANPPKLGEGMTAVKFDNNGLPVETTSADDDWYDYTKQKWANAKTADGSFWVWIPRYEYKINSTTKTFDVKFIPTSQTTANDGYIIHPVFTNNINAGGWDSELDGIWVAKYEASNSSSKPVCKPGAQSWRNISESDIYTTAYNYNRTLDSHQMKNTEWGAMAYLTQSQYGRNGTEVTINDSSSYYTGGGSGTAYISNVNQSTTGNVYGIYDTSGGAWEFVASYSVTKNSTFLSSLPDITTKYCIKYPEYNKGLTGDALGETTSWYGDISIYRTSSYPVFVRGGFYNNGTGAGSFSFDCSAGDGNNLGRLPCSFCFLI